ncbi:MAG: ABC transporter ATP-binding protein, partial [Anaerolineales bacterium]
LAPSPRLLMLDEPLGSLDRNLRERLVIDLSQILRQTKQTAIYVTHDQEEAFALANRIVLLNAGMVEQVDTPFEMYQHPQTAFVARFLGLGNLLPGEVIHLDGRVVADTPIGRFTIPQQPARSATILLRPDSIRLEGGAPGQLEGKLINCTFRGNTCRAVVNVNGIELLFDLPYTAHIPPIGETIRLWFDPQEAIQVFPIT